VQRGHIRIVLTFGSFLALGAEAGSASDWDGRVWIGRRSRDFGRADSAGMLERSAGSSMDRASDYGSEGWGFDSLPARYQGKRPTTFDVHRLHSLGILSPRRPPGALCDVGSGVPAHRRANGGGGSVVDLRTVSSSATCYTATRSNASPHRFSRTPPPFAWGNRASKPQPPPASCLQLLRQRLRTRRRETSVLSVWASRPFGGADVINPLKRGAVPPLRRLRGCGSR
jgi:hypothetical protein